MTDSPERRWYQFGFSIRDLLWLTAIVALSLGWWATYREHARAAKQERVWRENSFEMRDILETANVRVTFDPEGEMNMARTSPQGNTPVAVPNSSAPAPIPPKD